MQTRQVDYEAIFGNSSSVADRVFTSYDEIGRLREVCRERDLTVVLTSGTFDLKHVGHDRYLERAKGNGDFLIVGVDSDEKTRARKGEHRPVVDESERMETLCHTRYVGAVFLKDCEDERWRLIKAVEPDVLILVTGTYDDATIVELEKFCGKVVVLEPQATTSTSARIRRVLIESMSRVRTRLQEAVGGVFDLLDKLTGGDSQSG